MTGTSAADPYDVPIRDEVIRLGQFLKLANLVDSGAEAKPVVVAGRVSVNGEVDTRRGRQLKVGDVVALHDEPGGAVAAAARVADEKTFDDGLPW
ncbi:RNA-binding S4 domain-containing protein [Nocardioides sp. AX2bis]|uniref:RNA-binding S4 domain-containing protein n=1 Tax=Nocardioides sp. AX2bis TaxID=2653157 RepID=UPI0012F43DDA|nr:RNA-binding S4 domain-containing protein [Nocardioides sp. AX2bis]VXB18621.1 RNA-binding protein [Nocardioides sp. AX2bis]